MVQLISLGHASFQSKIGREAAYPGKRLCSTGDLGGEGTLGRIGARERLCRRLVAALFRADASLKVKKAPEGLLHAQAVSLLPRTAVLVRLLDLAASLRMGVGVGGRSEHIRCAHSRRLTHCLPLGLSRLVRSALEPRRLGRLCPVTLRLLIVRPAEK